MTRQNKLTEDDYLALFPLVRPVEIVAEFGRRSHCSSQIRNKYRKLKFETQAKALRALKNEILAQKPYSVPVAVWKTQMLEHLRRKERQSPRSGHASTTAKNYIRWCLTMQHDYQSAIKIYRSFSTRADAVAEIAKIDLGNFREAFLGEILASEAFDNMGDNSALVDELKIYPRVIADIQIEKLAQRKAKDAFDVLLTHDQSMVDHGFWEHTHIPGRENDAKKLRGECSEERLASFSWRNWCGQNIKRSPARSRKT